MTIEMYSVLLCFLTMLKGQFIKENLLREASRHPAANLNDNHERKQHVSNELALENESYSSL